jgi:hypothetical protein
MRPIVRFLIVNLFCPMCGVDGGWLRPTEEIDARFVKKGPRNLAPLRQ